MEVRSFLTGRRGVSLPFSDQCAPFFLDLKILRSALDMCIDHGRNAGWKHIDLRGDYRFDEIVPSWEEYFTHDIVLTRAEEDLFNRLTPSNRRNIRRAAQEQVSIEIGASRSALASFCRLNDITRKRHGLPPQPRYFFKNLLEYVLSAGQGVIISAVHGGAVVASSIYLHFGKQAVYKYGASVSSHLHLRPNNLIMWEAIKWYRDRSFEVLNLGRTELDNPGLLRYKRTWGADERLIKYYRFDIKKGRFLAHRDGKKHHEAVFSRLPVVVLRILGRLAYRHMG